MTVNSTVPAHSVTAPTAAFIREPVRCALSAAEALSRLAAEPRAFALSGRWAGGGAILGCEPLVVAGEDEDPFALLDRLPAIDGGTPPPPQTVGGGWFGWLGYRLAARLEHIPGGPPRPVAMPDFQLAYYDHVLRLDVDGRWWFEALVTDERRGELVVRRRHLQALLSAQAPRVATRVTPLQLDGAAAAHHLAAVAACRERIAAGEIFQANLCLRLHGRFDGSAADLMVRALDRGAGRLLVSRVRGRRRPGVGNGDVLRATFPPGSVTGAPKVQALRVIAESEHTGREVYTGAIGYAGPVAGLELSVAIRTLELRDGQLWLGVGGGIVADSDPGDELAEALVKAGPVAAAVGSSVVVAPRGA